MAVTIGGLYTFQGKVVCADLSNGTGCWIKLKNNRIFALLSREKLTENQIEYRFISPQSGKVYSIVLYSTQTYYFEKKKMKEVVA